MPNTPDPEAPLAVQIPSLHDQIARRAYELWEQEGCGHGSHERHWLEAESQILSSPTAEGRPTYPGDEYTEESAGVTGRGRP